MRKNALLLISSFLLLTIEAFAQEKINVDFDVPNDDFFFDEVKPYRVK